MLLLSVGDIEAKLRRMNREKDEWDREKKNQIKLDEDLYAAKSKIQSLQSSVDYVHTLEEKYQSLISEREIWATLFHRVVSKLSPAELSFHGGSSASGALAEGDINPTTVLRVLSDLQHRFAKLKYAHSQSEGREAESRRRLEAAEVRIADLERQVGYRCEGKFRS